MSTKNTLNPVKRFWLLLQPDKKEIRNVYIYAIFNGLLNLSLPIGIQAIINLIQGGRINTAWVVLVIFVLLGILLTGAMQIGQLRITENLQQKIFVRAAFEFAYRIPRIKLEAIYQKYAPELMNRFFDVVSIQKGLSKILMDFSTAAVQVVFGLVLLSLYHPVFIAFSIVLVALVYGIFRFTAKRGLTTSLQESKSKYKVAYWLEELARTNVTFKLAGKTDLPLTKTEKEVKNYVKHREGHFSVLVNQFKLMIGFKVVVAAGLLILGGILVMQQQMNIGQFVASEIIILLVIAAVEKLILNLENIYDVLTSLEKLGQITDLELDKDDGVDISEHIQGKALNLDIKNINFTYPGLNQKAINGLSLSIKAGEKILISGANGAGKSTLFDLISANYQPQQGQIVYEGFPQGNLNPNSLRSVIGDCQNEDLLFEGSLMDNITMGRENATFENVQWAVKNLLLEEFVQSLPKGYETTIQPEGKGLSRGIISKLLLARSIVAKPKLLLIKDIFSALEEKDRKAIVDFLLCDECGWTMLAISSSSYLAKNVSRVVVLDKGRVLKEGTYEEMQVYLNS